MLTDPLFVMAALHSIALLAWFWAWHRHPLLMLAGVGIAMFLSLG